MSSLLVLLKEKDLHLCDKIHVAPSLPEKKLGGALSTYGRGIDAGAVVALIDDTVFGSAKDGLLVTESALFCKEPFEEPRRIDFADIREVRMDRRKLFVNDKKIFGFTQPGREDLATFFSVLDRYIAARKVADAAVNSAATVPTGAAAADAAAPVIAAASEHVTATGGARGAEAGSSGDGAAAAGPAPLPATKAGAKASSKESAKASPMPAAAARPAPRQPAGLLNVLPQDGVYLALRQLNTVENVFGFAMAMIGEFGPIDEAKKDFQTFVVRSVTAFREEVVEKGRVPGLGNDLATYEVAGAVIGWLVAEMSRRGIPQNVMQQVLFEGMRATFHIKSSVQADAVGQVLLQLVGLHGEQADDAPATFRPHLALRLIGGNLQGKMLPDYDLDALLAGAEGQARFEALMAALEPAFERFFKTLDYETDFLIGRLQNRFPPR